MIIGYIEIGTPVEGVKPCIIADMILDKTVPSLGCRFHGPERKEIKHRREGE